VLFPSLRADLLTCCLMPGISCEAAERTWRHLVLQSGCRHELRQLHPLVRRLPTGTASASPLSFASASAALASRIACARLSGFRTPTKVKALPTPTTSTSAAPKNFPNRGYEYSTRRICSRSSSTRRRPSSPYCRTSRLVVRRSRRLNSSSAPRTTASMSTTPNIKSECSARDRIAPATPIRIERHGARWNIASSCVEPLRSKKLPYVAAAGRILTSTRSTEAARSTVIRSPRSAQRPASGARPMQWTSPAGHDLRSRSCLQGSIPPGAPPASGC
jgi:hypothetical protein